MELNEYQKRAMTTCTPSSNNYSYMFSNLVGEVGEFASKVGKAIRKDFASIQENNLEIYEELSEDHPLHNQCNELCHKYDEQGLNDDEIFEQPDVKAVYDEIIALGKKQHDDLILELKKEMGDIFWQAFGLCSVMGWSAEEICQMNLDKLAKRAVNGTIIGEGDNR